jgi:hypothetical protein
MWIDVIIANIIFWPIYIWICMLPQKLFQYAIDNA